MDIKFAKPGDKEEKPPEDWKLGEFVDATGRKFKSFISGRYRVKPSKYIITKGKPIKNSPWCFVDYKPRPRENQYACKSCLWELRCGSKV